ncbi:MAG: penicillin-binding protein [Clostridia bacterium]|nr:penicillin-binding protein [Clostridia bacterium]
MKKMESRALLCLFMTVVLVAGLIFFTFRLYANGADWATFYVNEDIYYNGQLNVGTIMDKNGEILAKNSNKGVEYNTNPTARIATVHAVGDCAGNVGTGAQYAFRSDLVGYSFLSGTYSMSETGRELYLTIDSRVCRNAYNAMANFDGTVGVYNYKTGEIVCEVSKPSYDPANPPEAGTEESGIYLNKLLSATITPGSTFKLVTTAAALDTYKDYDNWSYYCSGVSYINGERVKCTQAHGYVDKYSALAKSCNCAYADLTLKIGADNLEKYIKKTNMTYSYDLNGIRTLAGNFNIPRDNDLNLAWSGIGQFEDQVNPCAMMVYVGAIANGGKAANPYVIDKLVAEGAFKVKEGETTYTDQLLDKDTANELKKMMLNNVETNYGTYNYPGLKIGAKSGTAERGDGYNNTWFVGFLDDEEHPYAFVVCIEKGEWGSTTAGPIANSVLQSVIALDDAN